MLGPILMCCEVLIDLFQPLLMERIIDIGIKNNDLNFVVTTGTIMVLLSFLGFIGGFGSGIFSSTASQRAGADIRRDLFEKVQSFSYKNLDEIEIGNLITILTNDVIQVQQFFAILLRMMVRAPLMLVGSVTMTFYVSAKFGVILVGLIGFLFLLMFGLIRKAKPLFTKVQERVDQVNTVMLENLRGMRVVKSFVREDYEIKRFDKVNNDLKIAMTKASKVLVLILPLIMLVLNLGIVIVLWVGGREVYEGSLSVGQVVAVINYILRLLGSLMMLGVIFVQITRAGASAKRIGDVLESAPYINEIKENEKEFNIKGAIEFRNVDFSYNHQSNELVLQNISFKINPGETLAILGATGSGKSTLIQLIPRFYDVTRGEILIDGYNVREIPQKILRKNISIALQKAIIFSGTIEDNIKYGRPTASEGKVREVAGDAQALEFIDRMPRGLKTMLEERGANLSGGQKQRISIARALMVTPKILLLDDSTSAVDVQTESLIQKAINEKFSDTTVIIVAQRISSVLAADRIIVLDDGEIVADGNHEELIRSSPVYQDIYKSQLGEEVSVNVN